MQKYNRLVLLVCFLLAFAGVSRACLPNPPSNGVRLYTQEAISMNGTLVITDAPGIDVLGQYNAPIPGQASPSGAFDTLDVTTGADSHADAPNLLLPGLWTFEEATGPCANDGALIMQSPIYPGGTYDVQCISSTYGGDSVDPDTLSSTRGTSNVYVIAGSTPFSNKYGAPEVEIMDYSTGQVYYTYAATYVNSSELTVSYIPAISAGKWWVMSCMKQSNGTYKGMAVASVTSQ